MDKRITLANNNDFIEMLRNCADNGEKVSLLLDENGLTRAEGLIKHMQLDSEQPYFEIENGQQIKCSSIVALNGIFLDDYAQC